MVVSFPLDDDPKTSIIAWTTTPWTLPSNLACCVHPDFDYVKVEVERDAKLQKALRTAKEERDERPKKDGK